jgi:hypothetical protein
MIALHPLSAPQPSAFSRQPSAITQIAELKADGPMAEGRWPMAVG